MTSDIHDAVPTHTERIDLEIYLCAEGEATFLERVPAASVADVVDVVIGRYGLPEAVLRDETSPDAPPSGWIVPAPPAASPAGFVDTPFGTVALPTAYVVVHPVRRGFGFLTTPLLPGWAADPIAAGTLSDAGLLDSADAALGTLRAQYDAACEDGAPQVRIDALLQVHRRARSAGAMLLAAHAADTAGELLHRAEAYGVAASMHRWALGVYDRGRHHADCTVALANLAHALWHAGRHDAAAVAGQRARGIAERHGLDAAFERATVMTAYPLAELGRAEEALRLLDTIDPEPGLAHGWWLHARASCLLAHGELETAFETARTVLGAALHAGSDQSLMAEGYALIERILHADGDEMNASVAWGNAEICRNRLPAPLTH